MVLSIIVAMGLDNSIGKGGDLLWHLPDDLKRFKQTTMGHPIIMGRNTFFSLPKGSLPHRRNIVVSSQLSETEGVEIYRMLPDALEAVKAEDEVFIIGGGALYAATLPLADRLYLTRVKATFPDADTFFPPVDFSQWKVVEQKGFSKNEQNPYDTELTVYERIR